jgi:hypothetical protein
MSMLVLCLEMLCGLIGGYLSTSAHNIITQKTSTDNFTTMTISDLMKMQVAGNHT